MKHHTIHGGLSSQWRVALAIVGLLLQAAAADDAGRGSCMQATNAWTNEKVNDASMKVLDLWELTLVEKTSTMTTIRNTYHSGDALTNYQQACKDAGGVFDNFSGGIGLCRTQHA